MQDHYDDELDDEFAEPEEVGNVDASHTTVFQYLTHPDGGNVSPEEATRLLEKHKSILDRGVSLRSHAWFVGDRILEQE